MKRRSGFTLVEVLVSLGLLLLVMAMMISLLLPAFSLFRRQGGHSDAYRACLQAVERIRLELLNTQLETLTIAPDQQAISWQEPSTMPLFSATSGEPLMSDTFTVLHYQERRIFLTSTASQGRAPSTQTFRLAPQELESARIPTGRVLARDITEFSLSDNDPDSVLVAPPLRFTLTCTVPTKGRQSQDEESFQMHATFTPRSQRW